MTTQNIRLGYKESPLGIIPSNWEIYKLEDLFDFHKGQGLSKDMVDENGSNECILYGELYTNYNQVINNVVSKTNSTDGFKSVKGDILMPASTTTNAYDLVTASVINKDNVLLGGDINILRKKKDNVDGEFFSNYLTYGKKKELSKYGQGITIIHLHVSSFSDMLVLCPPLDEQKAIAKIIGKIDETIEKTKNIVDTINIRNKGLEQKLLTGRVRLKGFNEKRTRKKIGDEISIYGKKSTINDEYQVLTSSKSGLVTQREYYGDNRLIARENIGFNIIPSGFITYRSRSDDGKFTFNINKYDFTGIVSKYYPVFTCINGSNEFLVKYLNLFATKIGAFSIGTSQLVLGTKELCNIYLDFPSPKEQESIVQVLNQATIQLNTYKEKLEKLKELKKGLLQQLLTGKVRVKEFRN